MVDVQTYNFEKQQFWKHFLLIIVCFHPKEEPKAHSLAPHIKQEECGSFGIKTNW